MASSFRGGVSVRRLIAVALMLAGCGGVVEDCSEIKPWPKDGSPAATGWYEIQSEPSDGGEPMEYRDEDDS